MGYILQQMVNGLSIGSIYALTALGYTMVYGILRLINFAHGDVMMVGAYAALFIGLSSTMPIWLAALIAIIAGSIIGIIIERAAYKPLRESHESAVLVASLAVSILMQNLAILLFTPQPRYFPLPGYLTTPHIGEFITVSKLFYIILLVTIILTLFVVVFIKYTKTGIAMRACSENIKAAQLMGINVDRIITITFIIGSGLAGISGFMLAGQYGRVDPQMGFVIGLKAFVACVIGGIGNVYGAVVGGFLLGLSEMLIIGLLPAKFSGYRDTFVFTLLILVLLVRPTGIFEAVEERRG